MLNLLDWLMVGMLLQNMFVRFKQRTEVLLHFVDNDSESCFNGLWIDDSCWNGFSLSAFDKTNFYWLYLLPH